MRHGDSVEGRSSMLDVDAIAGRLLGWATVEDAPQRGRKLFAAWIVVSLHVTIRLALSIHFAGMARGLWALPFLLFIAGLFPPLRRPVAVVLAMVQLVRFSIAYPDVSNHYLVECLAVAAFAVIDPRRAEEESLGLAMLCWLGASVLFVSGLQKCLHGEYFGGQYLAYMVATTDRFRDFFAPLVPAADMAHLRSLEHAVSGMNFDGDRLIGPPPGPYRVRSMPFLLLSNAVWLGEMALPLGLLRARIRPFALAGSMVLLLGIVLSSREVFFDTLFLNLLLLFARSDLVWKLLPVSLASYGYYLLAGLGLVRASFVW
jgi:hypothetical protein